MKRRKRIAIRGFKHKKVPSHPAGCRGFLHPLKSKPEDYLVCDYCHWIVAVEVAANYGWEREASTC